MQMSSPAMFGLLLFEYELFGAHLEVAQFLKVLSTSKHCLSQESNFLQVRLCLFVGVLIQRLPLSENVSPNY